MNLKEVTKEATLENDSRYREAAGRLVELKTKLNDSERRYDEISNLPKGENSRSKLDRQVEALLAGHEQPDLKRRVLIEGEIEAAFTDRAVLRRAVELQERIVKDLAAEASKAICQRLEPHYRELVQSVAETAKAHAIACDELNEFLETLTNRDIQFLAVLRPMQFRHVGSLREENSHVNQYLKEAKEYGFIA